MRKDMELQQVVYHLLETQIKFGVHRYGESLPTITEASRYFLASVDTVRLAYLRLKQEGYITLSTCVGAVVRVNYSNGDICRHIQEFFNCRRVPLLDLAQSLGPLFHFAQWTALKSLSPAILDELERLCSDPGIAIAYRMSRQIRLVYGSLGNQLLMRLVWQIYLFFQGPFVSIPKNMNYFDSNNPVREIIRLCRQKDWTALWHAVEAYQTQFINVLCQFYQESIPAEANQEPIFFSWNIYQKTSQICYSLCQELLHAIRDGVYPVGSILPSPAKLAVEKKISLNTARRTVALLNKLGATKPINGVGRQVLSPLDTTVNGSGPDTAIQKRLLDFAQSFQILALSCRACAQTTLASMKAADTRRWAVQLESVRRGAQYENLLYICYELISLNSPYQAVRTVYAELRRQIFWGYSMRGLHGDREATNAHFLPYLNALQACLNRGDAEAFSAKLEELQIAETETVVRYLIGLGIEEAASIVIPSIKF